MRERDQHLDDWQDRDDIHIEGDEDEDEEDEDDVDDLDEEYYDDYEPEEDVQKELSLGTGELRHDELHYDHDEWN